MHKSSLMISGTLQRAVRPRMCWLMEVPAQIPVFNSEINNHPTWILKFCSCSSLIFLWKFFEFSVFSSFFSLKIVWGPYLGTCSCFTIHWTTLSLSSYSFGALLLPEQHLLPHILQPAHPWTGARSQTSKEDLPTKPTLSHSNHSGKPWRSF